MSRSRGIFAALLALFSVTMVHAESNSDYELYRYQRLFVDFGYGLGSPTSKIAGGQLGSAAFTMALVDSFQTTYPNNRLLGILFLATKAGKEAKVTSGGDWRLGVEYAATTWFTFNVGASHISGAVRGGGLNQFDALGVGGYLIMLASYSGNGAIAASGAGSLLYTLPYSVIYDATIPVAGFGIHAQAGIADVYIRDEGGAGQGIQKGEVAFGSRFRFSGNAYAYGEAFYTVYVLNGSYADQGIVDRRILNRGVRIGVGYAFDPPDTPKSAK